VIDYGGEKVGIVGYVTNFFAAGANSETTVYNVPIIEGLQSAVQELWDLGVNKVIALSKNDNIDADVLVARFVTSLKPLLATN